MDFKDDYDHIDPRLIYLPYSSGGAGALDDSDRLAGCDCPHDRCPPDSCSCSARSGTQYTHETVTDLRSYRIRQIDPAKPTYECNSGCACSGKCGNRLVQFGPRLGLKITDDRETRDGPLNARPDDDGCKGYGLTTEGPVAEGSFICEYAGEYVDEAAAKKRSEMNRSGKRTMNYVFCIDERFGDRSEVTYIDPTFMGNIGRYINHSCEPNSRPVLVRIETTRPHLCVFADRDIGADEEITVSYGREHDDEPSRDGQDKIACLCRSEKCNKFLPFKATC